jgi:hypothetical protein
MNTIAAQQGARFVMMLQPTLYTKVVVATEEQEFSEANSIDPVGLYHKKFEQMFHRAFLDLAKPFAFVDATKALDGGSDRDVHYVDRAHYNDRGAAILAAFLLDQIRPMVEEIRIARRTGAHPRMVAS